MDVDYCISRMKEKRRRDYDEEFKQDNLLSVTPSKLRFVFNYENFQVQEKFVKIANYFPRPCPVRFLPLETNYFKIKHFTQRTMLEPGSVFKLNVSFIPNENRDYNDVLKIRYFDGQEMQIKILATMITKFSLPTTVNFGNVPLGRSVHYKIPICSHAEKEFSFAILTTNTNSCVDVYPRLGRVKPKQNPVEIAVIYRPLRYISMNFQVRIFISNLCKAPHVVNFHAYTRPGLLREALDSVDPEEKRKTQRRKEIIGRDASSLLVEKDKSKSCSKELNVENTILKQCSPFPLHTLHAVNCILNTIIRKSYSTHELRGPLGAFLSKTVEQRAAKQRTFLVKVEERYRDNEQARFHQRPKVDHGIADDDRINEIRLQREQAWNDYTNVTTNSEWDHEREKVEKRRQRILRASQKYPTTVSVSRRRDPLFHYCKIHLFVQAAYRIVLRNRLLNTLVKLRDLKSQSVNVIEESVHV